MERPAGTRAALLCGKSGGQVKSTRKIFRFVREKFQICPEKCSDLFGKIFRFVRENHCVSTRAGKSSLLGKAFFVSAVDADADE